MCTLGGCGWGLKYLGPYYPHWRYRWISGFLGLVWPRPACCGHLGGWDSWQKARSLSLSLSSDSDFQTIKTKAYLQFKRLEYATRGMAGARVSLALSLLLSAHWNHFSISADSHSLLLFPHDRERCSPKAPKATCYSSNHMEWPNAFCLSLL